jgi:hypothetical protein
MTSFSTSTNATDPHPLPNDLIAFLTAAQIKASAQLTTAFHDLGVASIEDFNNLDDEVTTALANAMGPLEANRFRQGMKERRGTKKHLPLAVAVEAVAVEAADGSMEAILPKAWVATTTGDQVRTSEEAEEGTMKNGVGGGGGGGGGDITGTSGGGCFSGETKSNNLLVGMEKKQNVQTKNYSDGGQYVGQMKNEKRHGEGTITFAEGNDRNRGEYVGAWKDDQLNGEGSMTWVGKFVGQKYVGTWMDDKRHGQGTHTWADGDKYVGACQ